MNVLCDSCTSPSDPASVYLLSKSPFKEVTSAFSSLMLCDSSMRLVVEEACRYKEREKEKNPGLLSILSWFNCQRHLIIYNLERNLPHTRQINEFHRMKSDLWKRFWSSRRSLMQNLWVTHCFGTKATLLSLHQQIQSTKRLIRADGIERTDLQTSAGQSQTAESQKTVHEIKIFWGGKKAKGINHAIFTYFSIFPTTDLSRREALDKRPQAQQ